MREAALTPPPQKVMPGAILPQLKKCSIGHNVLGQKVSRLRDPHEGGSDTNLIGSVIER